MQNSKRIGLRKNHGFHSDFDDKKIEKYVNYLVEWIKEKVIDAHASGCVIGISGGIDSALCLALCKKAFPNDTLGIVMPIDDISSSKNDILSLSESQNAKFINVDLKETFLAIKKSFNNEIQNKIALANIKPRLRMTTLYAYAQEKNYLVIGTDNEDERFIGYFTKFGDGAADILPISRLLKSEVKAVAKYLNIPETIINKDPSADLWQGQTDEKELGFTYYELDSYIMNEFDDIKISSLDKIKKMNKMSEHKRNNPPMPQHIDEYLKK